MSSTTSEAITAADSTHPTVGPERPWLGLESFSESNSAYFFGRDNEAAELVDRIFHHNLTIMYGQSGLGKTSLVRAGLIPRLRDSGLLPIVIRLVYEADAPSLQSQVVNEVVTAIRAASYPQATSIIEPSAEVELWQLFHDPECGIVESGFSDRLVLIFDQFEEVWTLGHEKRAEDSIRFMDGLSALIENRPSDDLIRRMEFDENFSERLVMSASQTKILLSLREDYLHWIERWRNKMPSMMANRFELLSLDAHQAIKAVEQPGLVRRRFDNCLPPIIETSTAATIVRTVAGASPNTPLEAIENVPPLLSLVCEQLNAKRISCGAQQITSDLLKDSAGDVLEDFYHQCFHDFPEAIQGFVEDELISETGSRQLVTHDKAELKLKNAGVSNARDVLQQLVNMRLLAIEQRGGVARYELTHDVLGPIAKKSRDLRCSILEGIQTEKALAAAKIRHQKSTIVLLGFLCLVATSAFGIISSRQANELARSSMKAAQASREIAKMSVKAKRANDKLVELIRKSKQELEAQKRVNDQRLSNAYLKNGLRILDTYNQEDLTPDSVSLTGRSRWNEATSYLAESLHIDASNQVAARSLWLTLFNSGLAPSRIPTAVTNLSIPSGEFCVSPDGKIIVEFLGDQVSVQHLATDKGLNDYAKQLDARVWRVQVNMTGDLILACLEGGVVEVWNATDGSPVWRFPEAGSGKIVTDACFSTDGTKILIQSESDEAGSQFGQIHDIADLGGDIKAFPMLAPVRPHSFDRWSKEFINVSSSNAGSAKEVRSSCFVELRDLDTGELSRPFRAEIPKDGKVLDTAILPTQNTALFICERPNETNNKQTDVTLNLIDYFERSEIELSSQLSAYDAIVVSEHGDCFSLTTCFECAQGSVGCGLEDESLKRKLSTETVRWWHRDKNSWVQKSCQIEGHPRKIFFDPDGTQIYVHCEDNSLRTWNVISALPSREAAQRDILKAVHCESASLYATVNRDGQVKILNSMHGLPPAVRVDKDSPQPQTFSLSPHYFRSTNDLGDILRNPTGIVRNQHQIDLTLKCLEEVERTHAGQELKVMVSIDYSHLIGKVQQTLLCWEVVSSNEIGSYTLTADEELKDLSVDGSTALLIDSEPAGGGTHAMCIVKFDEGRKLGPTLIEETVSRWALNAQGDHLIALCPLTEAVSSCGVADELGPPFSVVQFRIENRRIKQSWRAPKHARMAAYSPDGKHLLLLADDNSLQVFDVRTTTPLPGALRLEREITYAWFNGEGNWFHGGGKTVLLATPSGQLEWDYLGSDALSTRSFETLSTEDIRWAKQIAGVELQAKGELRSIPDSQRLTIHPPESEPWRTLHTQMFLEGGGARSDNRRDTDERH